MELERAAEIVKIVMNSYNEGNGIFSERLNAEDFVRPEWSKQKKALFVFYAIQLDYATKSIALYEHMSRLFEEKEISPEFILGLSDEELASILANYVHPRYPAEAAMRWRKNSALLLEKYMVDATRIFSSGDAVKSIEAINEFRGFGPKIGSLFFRVMMHTFDFKLANLDKITQPIDVHKRRMTKWFGVLDSDNIFEIKDFWNKACLLAGISWTEWDKPFWLLGSQGCAKKRCGECPVREFCANDNLKNN